MDIIEDRKGFTCRVKAFVHHIDIYGIGTADVSTKNYGCPAEVPSKYVKSY